MKKVLVLCFFVLIAFSSNVTLFANDLCDRELKTYSVDGGDIGTDSTCGGSTGWTTNDPTEDTTQEPVVLPEHPAELYGYVSYKHMYVGDYFIPKEALSTADYPEIIAYSIDGYYTSQYGVYEYRTEYDVRHEFVGTTGLVLGYFTEPTEFQVRFFVYTEGYQVKEVFVNVTVFPNVSGPTPTDGPNEPTFDPPSNDTSNGSGILDDLEKYDSDYSELTLEIG